MRLSSIGMFVSMMVLSHSLYKEGWPVVGRWIKKI